MPTTTLVNDTHAEESRVATTENGVLADYEIETTNRASLKGTIYNAVVENVIPSLEAAFVRLGNDLKGFLPLDEVNFKLLPCLPCPPRAPRSSKHHPLATQGAGLGPALVSQLV